MTFTPVRAYKDLTIILGETHQLILPKRTNYRYRKLKKNYECLKYATVFVPGKLFQPILMFSNKAGVCALLGAPLSGRLHKDQTRKERPARDKNTLAYCIQISRELCSIKAKLVFTTLLSINVGSFLKHRGEFVEHLSRT